MTRAGANQSRYGDSEGRLILEGTANVVLAGGVLGTVPLLLHCLEKGTLPRLSSMLGSRVRTNSETLMGVTAKNDDVNYSTGIAITSSIYPDDVTHVEPVRYPDGSDLMSFMGTIFTESPNPLFRPPSLGVPDSWEAGR